VADSDLWPAHLAKEQLAALDAFEGPIRPALYNSARCHAWWNGQSFWEVTTALRAGLLVPAPRDFTVPRVSSAPTRAALRSSSRSVTSRRSSSSGVSFRGPAAEVKQVATPGLAPG
jgi:hypothetical protein